MIECGSPRRIVITGSSGFIGTHLVKLLDRPEYYVTGIDIRPPSRHGANFTYVPCDILDEGELARQMRSARPESVIHLGARTDLGAKRDIDSYSANIEGVRNLVAAVRSVPTIERCIYTSSQLVCRVGYVPKSEQDYCPDTLYGKSKVLTERIIREVDGGGVQWCLVRPTTVWGPGMSTHYQRFFRLIVRGHYFHVGREAVYKSYGYVGNVVHQYVRLLDAPKDGIHRKVFYLADYEPISLQAWADAFGEALGARPIRIIPKMVARALARLGDLVNMCGYRAFPFNSFRLRNILSEYRLDLSETKAVCGELPYTWEEGVKETAGWIVELLGRPSDKGERTYTRYLRNGRGGHE
jgi:nucleoside-diphosphate-sugar epimerase